MTQGRHTDDKMWAGAWEMYFSSLEGHWRGPWPVEKAASDARLGVEAPTKSGHNGGLILEPKRPVP